MLNCDSILPCKRLSRSVANVSVIDKDMEENEPVVSMDYVSMRESNILIIFTLGLYNRN